MPIQALGCLTPECERRQVVSRSGTTAPAAGQTVRMPGHVGEFKNNPVDKDGKEERPCPLRCSSQQAVAGGGRALAPSVGRRQGHGAGARRHTPLAHSAD